MPSSDSSQPMTPHRRRARYAGQISAPFRGEIQGTRSRSVTPDTVAKVLASGKTPAGTHRPIMVAEILEALAPKPGEIAVDCTLGYGGHAREFLARLQPGGRLLGLDADPVELPKTEARLRAAGFGPEDVSRPSAAISPACRRRFVAAGDGISSAARDFILADLGVSSMQLDDPARGFSVKTRRPARHAHESATRPSGVGVAGKNLGRTRWQNCCRKTPTNRAPTQPGRRLGRETFCHHHVAGRRHPRRVAAT